MKLVDTQHNPETSIALFKEYYAHHRNQQFKKMKIPLVAGAACLFAIYGFWQNAAWSYTLALALVCASLGFGIYQFWLTHSAIKMTEQHILQQADALKGQHQFGADSHRLRYVSNGQKNDIPWSQFTYYENVGDALYLYARNKRLREIISSRVVGDDMFSHVLSIAQEQLTLLK